MANDDVHIFIKREGTGDKGRDYENLFVSNVSLRLAKDNNQEFLISSNNGKFGSFDDVVMESINQVNFALQLKHSETAKHLNLESLGAKTGDFSIKSYFDSFKKHEQSLSNFNLILCTNRKFFVEENISVELDDGEKFSVKITECQADPLINTSKTSDKCYTFEVIKKQNYYSKKLDAYEEFFKKFYLYTDQCNVDQLKDEVYRQMRELFSCEDKICNRYLQYVSDWSKRSGKKEKLTTKTVQRIIALYLVDPFICSMNFDSECSNGKLLREAIFYFRVTVFKGNLESVVKIWTNLKNKQIENENNIITNKMYQISSKYVGTTDKLNDKEKTLLLWLLDECPLIVRMDDLVCKAIKFCTSGKFVLIGTNDNNFNRSNTLKDVEIFQNLSNLKDKNGAEHETWKSIIADFKCGLPGKEYSIEELIQEHSKLQTNINLNTIITTDDLLKMTDNGNIYKIQFRNEELPSPYIQRSVATHRINRKYLDTLDDSTLIVISNVTEQDQILFKHYSLVIVDEYLNTNVKNVLSSKKKQIYISESLCSQATFKKICDRNDGVKKCQHFKLSNRMLEWVKSNNEFVDLEKYYVKQELKFVEEKELFSLNAENNIHLISDHAGTGKSSLLKNFNNNNNSSQKLSMFLTPKEMLKICQHLKHKEMDEVENFIIDLKHSNDSAFVKEILKSMLHCGNIVYIWDALDEIEENYLEDIVKCIKFLCKNGSVHWLASRIRLQKYLENKFGVLAKSIKQFTVEEQDDYICKRLNPVLSKKELDEVVNKIRSDVTFYDSTNILSIPLQLFMLTELFREDFKKYASEMKELSFLPNLYKYFVEQRFNLFCTNQDIPTTCRLKADFLQICIDTYEKVALNLLLKDDDFLLDLKIDESKDCVFDWLGFFSETEDHEDSVRKRFIHISLFEYFAAHYFAKFVKKNSSTVINALSKYIFKKRYTNIRRFLDLLLAENSTAHIAVLYNNLEVLKKSSKDQILKEKDYAGRNVLQVACSWGERYPVLETKTTSPLKRLLTFKPIKECYMLNDEITSSIKEESAEHIELLEYLLTFYDVKEAEDSLEYAKKCHCLHTVALIDKEKKIGYINNQSSDVQCSLLYYAVRVGYPWMFDLFEDVKYIETRTGSLLNLAVENNQYDCLLKLLSVTKYKAVINYGRNGVTPLFLATSYGNINMTTVLLDHVAVTGKARETYREITSIANECKWNSLHLACFYGHDQVVKQLLKNKNIKIDLTDKEGFTPLHIACEKGYHKIVKLLIAAPIDVNSHIKDKSNAIEARTSKNSTALYLASMKGHAEIVKLLIKKEVDLNAVCERGFTALHIASQNGRDKVVKLLIEANVNVNATNEQGWTALHAAAKNGHSKIVELLINSGCNVNATTQNNMTPLQLASSKNHSKVGNLLYNSQLTSSYASCTPYDLSVMLFFI